MQKIVLLPGEAEEEDDNYEDEEEDVQSIERQKLLKTASESLSTGELDEKRFCVFLKMDAATLTWIVGQLSKEKAERLMGYLSGRQETSSKAEHHHKRSAVLQQPVQAEAGDRGGLFFNPSAPVWTTVDEEKVATQSSVLNSLLLRHEEEVNEKAGKDSSYLYKKRAKKYRMDPSQYEFEDFAKSHECPAESALFCPFFSVVGRVMYASGDHLRCDVKAVEMMHSQIEEIVKAIFEKKLIRRLMKFARSSADNIQQLMLCELPSADSAQEEAPFVFPKPSKNVKQAFNAYFQAVFAEQYHVYQQFRETYNGIKEEGTFLKSEGGGGGNQSTADEDDNEQILQPTRAVKTKEEDDEEEGENSQLREMKQHFDREDEDEMPPPPSQQQSHQSVSATTTNNKQPPRRKREIFDDQDSANESDQDEGGVSGSGNREKKAQLDSDEIRESLDTLELIEKVVKAKGQVKLESLSQLQQQEDRMRLNKSRSDDMTNEEWNYFMHARSTTFTSGGNRKTFVEFLNVFGGKTTALTNTDQSNFINALRVFIPFLGYCFCKIIGSIVEQILRGRTPAGSLKPAETAVTLREVETVGNAMIEKYIKRANKHVFSKDKLVMKSFRTFADEYYGCGYDKILRTEDKSTSGVQTTVVSQNKVSTRARKGKGGETPVKGEAEKMKIVAEEQQSGEKVAGQSEQMLKEQWRGMKSAYRRMWVERVVSEKQVKQLLEERLSEAAGQGETKYRAALQELLRSDSLVIAFFNKYAHYLYERALEDLQRGKNLTQIDFSAHFKNWFLNNDSQRTGIVVKAAIASTLQSTRDTRRKQIKFESILD